MNIILWLIFGGLAGWIASMIVGADASLGIIGNIVVGIAGAFVGGWIAGLLRKQNVPAERPTTLTSFITAVIGAVVLLLLANLIF